MKKFLFYSLIVFALASCASPKNWEYKIVSVKAEEASDFSAGELKISSEDLDLFGKDGWELVGVYTTMETVHPNFGDNKYVTGIQPNARTNSVDFVFKRQK